MPAPVRIATIAAAIALSAAAPAGAADRCVDLQRSTCVPPTTTCPRRSPTPSAGDTILVAGEQSGPAAFGDDGKTLYIRGVPGAPLLAAVELSGAGSALSGVRLGTAARRRGRRGGWRPGAGFDSVAIRLAPGADGLVVRCAPGRRRPPRGAARDGGGGGHRGGGACRLRRARPARRRARDRVVGLRRPDRGPVVGLGDRLDAVQRRRRRPAARRRPAPAARLARPRRRRPGAARARRALRGRRRAPARGRRRR